VLFNLPPGTKSLDQLPRDFKPAPLGEKSEVIAKLSSALPIDFSGGGDVMGAIRAASEALGVRALDCSTGDWIDFESPEADDSWRRWQAYRDKVIKRG
jgi:hypothetical protein